MVTFHKRSILAASLLYIYTPIAIFLFGWAKLYIAFPCCIALFYGSLKLFRAYTAKNPDSEISIDYWSLFLVIVFLLSVGYSAGWGRFTYQVWDWEKHNTVLKDLIERPWPVYYFNGDEHSMLTYYIGQYMVPALFGKVCGSFRMAEIMNYIWAEIGLFLIYINLIRILQIRKWPMQWLTGILLAHFNGPLLLAQKVISMIYPDHPAVITASEWFACGNDLLLQYTNHFVSLQYVFPQVLVIWLLLLLFYEHREMPQHYITLLLPGAIFGVLSFAGAVPFAIGYVFFLLYKDKDIKKLLAQIFSIQNCICFFTFGAVLILYYYGNVLSAKPEYISFRRMDYGGAIWFYIVFVGMLVLLNGLLIFADNKKNFIFYIATFILLVIPFYRMGIANDFGMRCSIPALFFYFIFIVQFLNEHISSSLFSSKGTGATRIKLCTVGLSISLFIGIVPTLYSCLNIIISDDWFTSGAEKTAGSLEVYASRYLTEIPDDLIYNYYSYDIEDNLFYQYIARKQIDRSVE